MKNCTNQQIQKLNQSMVHEKKMVQVDVIMAYCKFRQKTE